MAEMISNLKKHTCPTCGGQLIVNEVRRMYECPFCGVTFDYEYFREDDVLDRAARAMRAGEMKSAQEAYEFMLAKEPSNFEALRGMILVAAHAKSTYEFARAESLKKMNTPLVDERIQYAIDNCLPEHRDYFSKMKELFDATDTYEEGLVKNRNLRLDQKRGFSDLQRMSDKKRELYFQVSDVDDPEEKVLVHPKSVAFLLITGYVFYCLIVIVIFAAMRNPYTKDTTSTKKTKATAYTRSTYSYSYNYDVNTMFIEQDLIEMYEKQGMDPTEASKKAKDQMKFAKTMATNNVYTYNYSAAKEKKAEESESVRKEKEKEWKKDHANDGTKRLLWLLIPGLGIGLICAYLFWRENKIRKYDREVLASYREKTGAITDEILKNEDSTSRQKFQLHKLYQEMKKLDPVPEKVSAPTVKMHKKQRKRWE
ncbi:MAG: transposase [Clostridiales bacterium]|nr:transposase [Clostridiales bacterium]